MPNELYKQMQGRNGGGNPVEQSFLAFANQIRGQNPRELLNQVVQSWGLTQQQLNAAQQEMSRAYPMFEALKGRIGF